MMSIEYIIKLWVAIFETEYSSLPRSSHSDVGGSHMESSNSVGLLSSLDASAGATYADIAALETVSEDQEAGSNKLRPKG